MPGLVPNASGTVANDVGTGMTCLGRSYQVLSLSTQSEAAAAHPAVEQSTMPVLVPDASAPDPNDAGTGHTCLGLANQSLC